MAIQILLFGGRTACSLPVRDGDHDGLRFPGLSIPQVLNEIAAGYGTFVLKETQSQVLLCRPSNKRSESTCAPHASTDILHQETSFLAVPPEEHVALVIQLPHSKLGAIMQESGQAQGGEARHPPHNE